MLDPAEIAPNLRVTGDIDLVRIEDAGLNAAQPPEQLLVDGWLLRFSRGKARRARSVNAIGAGRLDLEVKLEICRRHFEVRQLPLLFRITPFSQPTSLDSFLQRRGFVAIDETRVMTCPLSGRQIDARHFADGARLNFRSVDIDEFATTVGVLRDSPAIQVRAHEARLRASPLLQTSLRRVVMVQSEPVAAGQTVVEAENAGLYDVVTAPMWRGRGIGRALSAVLLADAMLRGARTAYLQVDAGNAPARSVYTTLGFVDRYAYWYRQPAGVVDDLHH
jgi:ribosomal protein S18 acetylase RimI-like enzyme